ncbi:hypothetical protein ACFFJY_13790 [Fictibacillus aquaticus]|uniref:Uncharacterized protein n=1 Tax=Fictibacillus aquaticus TaxID=2021314 RepID=A0A235FE91_9BACL|nr:hypothetical protein [Fictibacillus aquaticus]OYD59293.1 hypothetical protein CGZ90_05210 [Fictibacillus aquaticus]
MSVDKRGKLDEEFFSYSASKNGTVFLEWYGKQVKILKGKEAQKFIERIQSAADEKERQLIMAKVTGNFKRGNER